MKHFFIIALVVSVLVVGASAQSAEPPCECHGNEPFWSLTITGSEGKRETPGDEGVETTYAQGVFKKGEGWTLWRGIFPDWDDTVALITDTPCSDGMSDLTYPRRVILSLPDGDVYQGCCGQPLKP